MPTKLEIGDLIPNFCLNNQNGEELCISPSDKQKRVIYFYPKNNTQKCTEQACSFRDWQDEFVVNHFDVIGISADSVNSHKLFNKHYKLNFTLLSDPKGRVRRLFGASVFFGIIPSRRTYIINEAGRIVFIYDHFFEGIEHVQQVLAKIRE